MYLQKCRKIKVTSSHTFLMSGDEDLTDHKKRVLQKDLTEEDSQTKEQAQ